jgi:hypothetical protein
VYRIDSPVTVKLLDGDDWKTPETANNYQELHFKQRELEKLLMVLAHQIDTNYCEGESKILF